MPVLTILTPRDVARKGHTRQVIAPRERQFPTILHGPRARGSTRFAGSVSWGANSPSVRLGVFLSTHLHDPCLCKHGHDLSNEDNIVRLWLLGIHG